MGRQTDAQTDSWYGSGGQGAETPVKGWKYLTKKTNVLYKLLFKQNDELLVHLRILRIKELLIFFPVPWYRGKKFILSHSQVYGSAP